jgi:hypothetical protein
MLMLFSVAAVQALGSLPQTSGRPASGPSGRVDAAGGADDPTGRRAVSTSAIAASPFANGAESLERRGSPALGPGVPVEALAAAMPSSHSATQLEEDDSQGAAASGRGRGAAAEQGAAGEDGHAQRRVSGADGNVSVSAAAPGSAQPAGVEKGGSGDSSGGRSPSVSGLLRALPDRRPPPRLDCSAQHAGAAGESPRMVTSPRDLGVFASYPIPEEEAEGAEGEQQAAAAAQLPDAQEAGKPLAGKSSSGGGGQKRESAALDADGSGAVQQQQLMAGSEGGPAVGLREAAAH